MNMMTPETLDEWLQKFGDNVSMRTKNGGKQCPVDNLRKYIKQAIEVAVQRDREGKTNEQNN
jgi:hypothetical protein